MKSYLSRVTLILVALFVPLTAFAHEKWFVSEIPAGSGVPAFFTEWSGIKMWMIAGAVGAFAIACLIHNALSGKRIEKNARSFFASYKGWVAPIMRGSLGLLLVGAAYDRVFMAPDLSLQGLPGMLGQALVYVQLLIGLLLALGIVVRFASLLGIIVLAISFMYFPLYSLMSYVAFLGLFLYLAMLGDASLPNTHRLKLFPGLQKLVHAQHWEPYALPLLRIIFGICFISEGVYFKVIEPRYTLELVQQYGLNFMPMLGMTGFSDAMFVFSAGLTEVLLGVLLLVGILPRLVALFIMGMFTLTTFIFGMPEILGHLPLYAGLFAILVFGPGRWTLLRRE